MHSVKKIRDLMRQAEIGVNKQTGVISQVIRYITVPRRKARELSVRTRKEGQNQKVNITINTTREPNINNTQGKINTGRGSHKLKTEKTNKHRIKTNTNTKLTGQGRDTGNRLDRTGDRNRKTVNKN